MLYRYINQFLGYCRLADFSERSIQALTIRSNEFTNYLKTQRIRSVKKITYQHLVDFVADYKNPSIHVRKSRVWILRQFFHFLTLHQHVPKNIATKLPYPKIEKTVPQFLTTRELKLLTRLFSKQADTPLGLRNLVVIENLTDACQLRGVWMVNAGNHERHLFLIVFAHFGVALFLAFVVISIACTLFTTTYRRICLP